MAETINLEGLDGYSTGGVLHIIANNQIGFTTEPHEARSTRYASDLAKGFDIPIIHVNADDPEACIAAVRLAMAYREEWRRGAVIDLIGYRRLGHNEADEPAYTQPRMYELIKKHPPVRKLYADALVAQGIIPAEEPDRMLSAAKERARRGARGRQAPGRARPPASCSSTARRARSPTPRTRSRTCCRAQQAAVHRRPRTSTCIRKLAPQRAKRAEVGPDDPVDWGQAEALAFGDAADAGTPAAPHRPGQRARHVQPAPPRAGRRRRRASATPRSSTSRARRRRSRSTTARCPRQAALGFEYGYGVQAPEALVMWEAQFGDFVNAAQVAVDQFIVSGLAKWGETSRLTLLLPHGYEGAGPEHSSAREERFLTLAAEGNIRVRQRLDAGPVLPPAAPPGAGREDPAADRVHAEEPAAQPALVLDRCASSPRAGCSA